MNEPTRAQVVAAYEVIRFLMRPDVVLNGDWYHLNHVVRLLAEYALNTRDE